MVTLCIVFVGLFAIVPPKDTVDPATVLLLDVRNGATASDGHEIPPHCARVFFEPKGHPKDQLSVWNFEGEDLQFKVGTEGSPTMNVSTFVEMAKIVGKPVSIMPGCMGDKPKEECRFDSQALLAGRVKLFGGDLSPLNVSDVNPKLGKIATSKQIPNIMGFRSLRLPQIKSEYTKTAANGLKFVKQVTADFNLEIGPDKIPLELASPNDCAALDVSSPCIAIKVINVRTTEQCDDLSPSAGDVTPAREEAAMVKAANQEHKGNNNTKGDIAGDDSQMGDKLDRHFELFYPLLANYTGVRFVPYPRMGDRGIIPDPPESRCIQPLIAQ